MAEMAQADMAGVAEAEQEAATTEPPVKRLSCLREEDEAFFEEDEHRNQEQAERNATMRAWLLERRHRVEAEPSQKPTALDEFVTVDRPAPSRPASEDDQPPWFVMRPSIDNPVLRLHEELLDFFDFMQHTPHELTARREWVQTVTDCCRELWPGCKVRVFGSFYTGLSLPNGDVDIAVTDVPCKQGTAMKILADRMLANGDVSWLEIIESAKVPVVKLRSQACGLRADIVINVADGIDSSKYVRDRLKEYPQMRPMLVFLKYFLLQRGLHETFTGGMGSYLLCNVVLHFLQRHPARHNPRQYLSTSLGHLLFDFLKYYGQEFQYERQCISVAEGGNTFNKSDRGFKGKGKGKGKQLCVESPLDSTVDLGAACFKMPVLRNLFSHSFHCICALYLNRSPPENSMLCPFLLDPKHPVITDRHKLLIEQPVALRGLPRARERAARVADGDVSIVDYLPPDELQTEPITPPQQPAAVDASAALGGEEVEAGLGTRGDVKSDAKNGAARARELAHAPVDAVRPTKRQRSSPNRTTVGEGRTHAGYCAEVPRPSTADGRVKVVKILKAKKIKSMKREPPLPGELIELDD